MKRTMLINAQVPEELRLAIVTDGVLDTYEVAAAEAGLTRGNIYRGVVASVQPSLDAAFVEYGAARHGLIKADDVLPTAAHRKLDDGERHHRIDKMLEKGRPLLVQVTRDPIDAKGAVLTTNVSFAGRYLVLMPLDEVRGVSRKLEDEEIRRELREKVDALELPEKCGVIVRTNAIDQNKTTLNRDLGALLRLWKRVQREASQGKGPKLLYSDQDLIVQALRDLLDSSVEEVWIDSDDAYDKAQQYVKSFMPRAKTQLVRYRERMPLFSKYQLEEQIESIYQRRVALPKGGSIVIDGTEALTAIDVNSGRSRGGGSQEETATATNLEAAAEVARQLRLRDIGGLVVVDFIDMRSRKHRGQIEKALKDAMKPDKARWNVGRISPNGLLEINRQRIKQALQLRTHRSCPTCGGAGIIASPELIGLNILRRIETRAVTGRLQAVRVELHPELADAIQNTRRRELAALEAEFEIRIEVIAAPGLHRSEERVEWTQREVERRPAPPRDAAKAADVAEPGRGDSADAPAEAADPRRPDDDGKPAVKRRSRGGRRRRKKDVDPTGAPTADDSTSPGGDDGHGERTDAATPDAAAAGDDGEPAKTTARRRRRRRKKAPDEGAGSAEPHDAAGPGEVHEPGNDDPDEPDGADGSPARKKRRRRRRRKPAGAAGPGEESAAEAPSIDLPSSAPVFEAGAPPGPAAEPSGSPAVETAGTPETVERRPWWRTLSRRG